MSLKKLFEQLDERFPMDEDNTTSSGGEYMTPFAFSKEEEYPEHESSYTKKVQSTERFFKKIEERINEIAYSDYKKDDSRNTKQKINSNILEINKKLREVEQMINHASKLKTETGQDQSVFWKGTSNSFLKIKERLTRLTNKIVEITG